MKTACFNNGCKATRSALVLDFTFGILWVSTVDACKDRIVIFTENWSITQSSQIIEDGVYETYGSKEGYQTYLAYHKHEWCHEIMHNIEISQYNTDTSHTIPEVVFWIIITSKHV